MRRFTFGLAVLSVMAGNLSAQQPPPGLPSARVQHVFPAGIRAGASVEVTVTGTDLEEPEKLLFAHPGLKGEWIKPPTEPTPDPKDPKKTTPPPKTNPAGPHTFKVTAAADVPPGVYDLRVVGKWGASNPRSFVVGDLPEVNEKEPNNDVPDAQKIEIGTTVNGVIANPTDVDYTTFAGKKGQRVLVSCLATSVDSKATPMIEVYEATGRKLATSRNYRESDALTDVVLPADGEYLIRLFQFTYTAGGPDYVYRLTVSAAPWIDAVFPPVVEPGKPTPVTLYGRNLPGGQPTEYTADGRALEKLTVSVTPPGVPAAVTQLASRAHVEPTCALQDGFGYSLKGPNGTSNPVTIYFARDKLTVKTKSAGGPDAAEVVPTPGEVAGFLARRGERDWVAFVAKKGEKVTIDLAAERIGASGDFFFSVRDGKDPKRDLSGDQDDDNDTLHPSGFYTRTTDPAPYQFTAPEDGRYLIAIGCRESSYLNGPTAAYRLRIGQPLPDFRAVVMPYSRFYQTGSSAWQGGTQAYHVFAHRTDGYSGAIGVTVEGLPAGVTAQPLTIGPAARWGVLVLDVAPGAAPANAAVTVKLTGTDAAGKKLERVARPASVVWGTNQPDQNVPVLAKLDQSLVVAIRAEKAPFSIKADIPNAVVKPASGKDKEEKVNGPVVVLRQGDKATVPVKVSWTVPEKPNVTLTAEPLAQNQQGQPVAVQFATQPTKDKPDVLVNIDAKTGSVPGTYTIVFRGTAPVAFAKDPTAKQKPNVPAEAFGTPITVLVVPSALGRFTTGPLPNNTLKLGTSTDLPIKVERLHDFAGEYKVSFVPAKDATGVTATDVVIAAGKDEVKLLLKTAPDAKPGALAGTVVVTALYGGKHPVTYENKVSFNLAK
ncbi:hypothetical protein GobsT_01300 [Gemmata obscuriglobus]|uniref:Peptidase C-terminal archaeal/bacterial domain-containing protein n=1 Tax=Gemmata obscuriglobus TaxID=114 RepID=A0A2Z3H8P0_9BACT|nr:peptidase [Gemmata obscuriglobus]AWM41251.1 hypothetical protein C1280_32500 [Gemmata obscuriglobus]QEG25404.1 hypothetical protein GobsT_01300 [Gemmata obscuriglobus]VTR98477.1 Hypothetical conserved protein OS=uncultured planctomycete GN=HGMM_F07G10C28 PE=4 SV=1 [Gemmata obscuriglobus UQM 2246]